MESRELDVRPEDREGSGPVAELVDDDEHQGGYAELVEGNPSLDAWPSTFEPNQMGDQHAELVTSGALVEHVRLEQALEDALARSEKHPPAIHTDGRLIDVTYEDESGRWWKVLVPEGADTPASMGIPVGPPDISELNLPHDVGVRLHNQLFTRGLFTRDDLRGRGREVHAALQAAYRVDAVAVTALYR